MIQYSKMCYLTVPIEILYLRNLNLDLNVFHHKIINK